MGLLPQEPAQGQPEPADGIWTGIVLNRSPKNEGRTGCWAGHMGIGVSRVKRSSSIGTKPAGATPERCNQAIDRVRFRFDGRSELERRNGF